MLNESDVETVMDNDQHDVNTSATKLPEERIKGPSDTDIEKATLLPLDSIVERHNIRGNYQDLEDLATSIREQGLLEPILVRPSEEQDGSYDLIAGYRRLAAARMLGWSEVAAIVKSGTESECLQMAVVENIQRQSLSAIEEARAIKMLIEMGIGTRTEIARMLGRDPSYVTHRLNLLEMPVTVQNMVDEGKLTASHVKILERLPDEKKEKFAEKAINHELSVHKLEQWVVVELETEA
jgi:ParB family chromosome partitioning protein